MASRAYSGSLPAAKGQLEGAYIMTFLCGFSYSKFGVAGSPIAC
jgi:hypothetical protein